MTVKTNQFDTTKKVFFFSRFLPKCDADGGFRRTSQIAGALKGLDYAFASSIDFYPEFYSPGYMDGPQYREYLSNDPLPSGYLEKWAPKRRDNIAYLHHVSWVWQKRLESGSKLKLAVVDDPIYFAPLVRYLALNDIPIVANCHNVEALSRSQLNAEHQMELFNYEIDILSLCSLVVTISREETVLLRNLGINALYYPYYPVKDIHDRMLGIRQKRKDSIKEDFLLVGTAHNPPTMKGMQEIMGLWGSLSGSLGNARLYVAGFGSELLKDFADGENVVFKGPLSDEDLDNMLVKIKGCIAYQGDGSGALTKICEFLLAGVPVLANSHAARSYYNTPGVFEFTDIHDIARASKLLDSAEMEVPIPGRPDSAALLSEIESLLGDEGTRRASQAKSLAEGMLSEGRLVNDNAVGNSGMKKALLEKLEQLDQLRTDCETVAAERDAIAAERDALAAEKDAAAAYCDELLSSLSWRITAPLRYLGKFFTRK